MTNETLEDRVLLYRRAVQINDQYATTDLYKSIRQECTPVTRQVAANLRENNILIEDIADEKLQDCLDKYPHGREGNFRGFYRRALVNKCVDIMRKRNSEADTGLPPNLPARPRGYSAEDLEEALTTYRTRKRNVVNRLKFNPLTHYATLLIDQRQRLAGAFDLLSHLKSSRKFPDLKSWVEHFEIWNAGDGDRSLAKDENTVGQIWSEFSERAESRASESLRKLLVEIIDKLGTGMNDPKWRKRISRYLKMVKDQVDNQEWKLFHA